jgi:2-polyprenyl-6-methoxyphenol hydroxylase-like FAD-dependent oxidoreductase
VNRLKRWHVPGLLCIGDAAHAMSPVGGVGINLAVADAVATARLLAPALRSGEPLTRARLARVQLRRWLPTALIQSGQRLAHRAILGPALRSQGQDPLAATVNLPTAVHPPTDTAATNESGPAQPYLPLPLRLLQRFPVLQGIPARLVAIGPLPEHAPGWARRAPAPAATPTRN